MCASIQELYASLLTGKSPCHEFTKVPGHTGGFYHIVCRHGVNIIVKSYWFSNAILYGLLFNKLINGVLSVRFRNAFFISIILWTSLARREFIF